VSSAYMRGDNHFLSLLEGQPCTRRRGSSPRRILVARRMPGKSPTTKQYVRRGPDPVVHAASWTTGTTETNGQLCRQFRRSVVSLFLNLSLVGEKIIIMATLCNRAGHHIFALWCLSSSIFYLSFPRLISAAADWMYYHTHMVWP